MSDSAKLFTDINLIQESTSRYQDFIKRKLIAIVASLNDTGFSYFYYCSSAEMCRHFCK